MTYAGDVTPLQAWTVLQDEPDAALVDVRTQAEWTYVGLPDLGSLGKAVVRIEWQQYPGGRVNETFAADLEAAGVLRAAPVYFLCRSGVRSVAAARAAAAAGWARAYNVLDGFEGPHDAARHRNVSGWKVVGLPWVQG
jgi:rhodanese-related sulfurtransferase